MTWQDKWAANDEAERREAYLPAATGRPSGWGTWRGPPPGRGCAGLCLMAVATSFVLVGRLVS